MSEPSATRSDHPGEHDPGTYGRSFADVYDDWYPEDHDSRTAVETIRAMAGDGGTVLELGVGTGRLALPLAEAGLRVLGIDASAEMLARLAEKDPTGRVQVSLGDVSQASAWPSEHFDVIVAAFNLLLNLPDASAQARTVGLAADHLVPGGHLVVEAVLPAPLEQRERRMEVREVDAGGVVLIATDADPASGIVLGQHIEMRDGAPLRLRPWVVRMVRPDELDRWAAAAGLELVGRSSAWERISDRSEPDASLSVSNAEPGTPACAGEPARRHVSLYRRAG